MILEIGSSLESFKTVRFHCGMNILLADSKEPERKGYTRNSSGKTSLVEIVHFLLGARQEEGKLYTSPELQGVRFYGTFQLNGAIWKVARTVGGASKIIIIEGDERPFGISAKIDPDTEERTLSLPAWKGMLGNAYFRLPLPASEEDVGPYAPSFRGLIGYFCRRHLEGGFQYAERYAAVQKVDEAQILLSYLFGLDWELARDFVVLSGKRKSLKQLERAAKGGLLSHVIGKPSELRPQLLISQRRAEKLRRDISDFRVVEAYESHSKKASSLKSVLRNLSERSQVLQESLETLRSAADAEAPPDPSSLHAMYAQIGIQLPGVVLRKFSDVEAFHKSVVENRKKYLAGEIARLSDELEQVRQALHERSEERRGILSTLNGSGALEDLALLQKEFAAEEAKAAALSQQLTVAQRLETEGTDIRLSQIQLEKRLQVDLSERSQILTEAMILMAELGREVYSDRDVRLHVDVGEAGPVFSVDIPGDRGGGIHNVEIFLMDVVLFVLASQRFGQQRFLVHDSHLFDGIDERQIAQCLSIAERLAFREKGQYIVTMNSDMLGKLPSHIWSAGEKYVLDPRLTDEKWGGLFGMRFDAHDS